MSEPSIEVGLVAAEPRVSVHFDGVFADDQGDLVSGEQRIEAAGDRLYTGGRKTHEVRWTPTVPEARFALEATIGVDFHWQQREQQSFAGGLRVFAHRGMLTLVNHVPLEVYLASVICSEMSATSPAELARAHSVVSRSWLLAQRAARVAPAAASPASRQGELIRWYDREGHPDFDVCADDHCQRYHGTGRIHGGAPLDAVRDTRGEVLTCAGQVCDARYSKACGGVTEDFTAAWGDEPVPYLVPVGDWAGGALPAASLTDESAFRRFLDQPPAAFCHCDDAELLDRVLTSFDRETGDFFRWQQRITAGEASRLVEEKLGLGLGRILALVPVERGRSGRLVRLELVGENGRRVIGKELEIRRVLSPSHLYSSAFVVEIEGPAERPDAFLLRGAGWGHGVGLCQIGAAVMASRGFGYREILRHYYPGAEVERLYE
jgi:SpoIID/LytB domain protein